VTERSSPTGSPPRHAVQAAGRLHGHSPPSPASGWPSQKPESLGLDAKAPITSERPQLPRPCPGPQLCGQGPRHSEDPAQARARATGGPRDGLHDASRALRPATGSLQGGSGGIWITQSQPHCATYRHTHTTHTAYTHTVIQHSHTPHTQHTHTPHTYTHTVIQHTHIPHTVMQHTYTTHTPHTQTHTPNTHTTHTHSHVTHTHTPQTHSHATHTHHTHTNQTHTQTHTHTTHTHIGESAGYKEIPASLMQHTHTPPHTTHTQHTHTPMQHTPHTNSHATHTHTHLTESTKRFQPHSCNTHTHHTHILEKVLRCDNTVL